MLNEISDQFKHLRQTTRSLRTLTRQQKDSVLHGLADQLSAHMAPLLEANKKDLEALPEATTSAFRDRLLLNPERLTAIAESLRAVAELDDPVGEVLEERTLENGLRIRRERAPLGLILMIFESRPNVIFEAFSLAFKSGNAIALRGGSDSKHSAHVIYQMMRDVFHQCSIPYAFLGIENYDRALVLELLQRKDWIDIVVPRGGDRLIELVQTHAKMPIIKNDRGLCHAFVEATADLAMAAQIVVNGKMSRPAVCNSLETVLIDQPVAREFLKALCHELTKGSLSVERSSEASLEIRCDPTSLAILEDLQKSEGADWLRLTAATEADWNTEHLDYILNCRVVANLAEALAHIDTFGSKHSETIITSNANTAHLFQSEVDAAVVYWNASTRFTDGFQFGLGGELGISTQKLHVRGPVGLRELTTPRWIAEGSGQTR